jgi:hypothetical protein
LEWLEKIPFLKKYIVKVYDFFVDIFVWFEGYMEKIFHIPAKQFFRFLTKHIKKRIYMFIGYTKVSAWKRLQEVRQLELNSYHKLLKKRSEWKEEKSKKQYISTQKNLSLKRKKSK